MFKRGRISKDTTLGLSISILFALLILLYVQLPALRDPYRIHDDLRQYFWMERFQDPDIFPNDHIISQVKRVQTISVLGDDWVMRMVSPGFSLLYQLGSFFIKPTSLSKILPFISITICAVYLFLLGRQLKLNAFPSFISVVFFVLFSLTTSANVSLTTGLERSLQFVLLVIFLYYLVRDSAVGIGAILVFQALFYAPMFVVSVLIYCVSLIRLEGKRIRIDFSARRFWALVIALTLSMLVLLPGILDSQAVAQPLGEQDGAVPIWRNPNYGPEGRIPIFPASFSGFPTFLIVGYGGLMGARDMMSMIPLLLLALIMLASLGIRGSLLTWKINSLPVGSLTAWLLCWLIALITWLFPLRYPFKYTSAPLLLWLMLYCSINSERFLAVCAQSWHSTQGRRRLLLLLIGVFMFIIGLPLTLWQFSMLAGPLGAIVLIVGLGLFMAWRQHHFPDPKALEVGPAPKLAWVAYISVLIVFLFPQLRGNTMTVPQEERPLLEYTSMLPKDVLIAGDPQVLSNIPLFSKRKVFFSEEVSYVGGTRVVDFYDAYYSPSREGVISFCDQYYVDYLVVNEGHFDHGYLDQGKFFFSPYNERIKQIVALRSSFYLPTIPAGSREFQGGSLFLVPCSAEAFK